MAENYATPDDLQTWLSESDDEVNDDAYARALTSASRAVEKFCHRRFYQETRTRAYRASDPYRLAVHDIATTEGLLLKTDLADTGSYDTTLDLGADFIVEPPDAIEDGEPITRLSLIRGVLPCTGRRYPVQVAATFGWPEIPEGVVQSTLMKAARLVKRAKTADGILDANDFGAVRISTREDPDVVLLLTPLVRNLVLVA